MLVQKKIVYRSSIGSEPRIASRSVQNCYSRIRGQHPKCRVFVKPLRFLILGMDSYYATFPKVNLCSKGASVSRHHIHR
jgi:hypothetical protein